MHSKGLRTRKGPTGLLTALILLVCHFTSAADEREALGQALFSDTNLSLRRNQSCSTCHDPNIAYSDGRNNNVSGAVSLGDDGVSLGDRNAPSLTYAFLIPAFYRSANGDYVGGFFRDGRASTLIEQLGEPFTNPLEMAMPDIATVVERVKENPSHVTTLKNLYGNLVFENPESAFQAVIESIAAFEQTATFAPFDSKYDRYLNGLYDFTREEELGRVLFFSQLTNCHRCHLLNTNEFTEEEPFTDHRYRNIGLPKNTFARQRNQLSSVYADTGLLQNPAVTDTTLAGKFRVPSLRNVAVTGPYMHNGIFEDLITTVLFYNKYTLGNPDAQINPETTMPWEPAEVEDTIDYDLLRTGQPISIRQARALVAFLETLTDHRYETLLER